MPQNNPMDYEAIRSNIQKGLEGHSTILGRQKKSISEELLESIYGSADDFLNNYREFENMYIDMLSDPKNRRIGAMAEDFSDVTKLTGRINLNYLNISAQRELQSSFLSQVLKLEDLLEKAGMPGIEFPSQNLYSKFLLQYDIDQSAHPAAILLNKLFFNVDPNKLGLAALRTGLTHFSSKALEDISYFSREGFDPSGKSIMYLDVETTGPTQTSPVRQFSYRILNPDGTIRETVTRSFAKEEMDIATASISGRSTLLSEAVEYISGGRKVGAASTLLPESEYVKEMTNFLNKISEQQYVTAYNAYFDIPKTIESLISHRDYEKSPEAKEAVARISARMREDRFIIDPLEPTRAYIKEKAARIVGEDYGRFATQLLGPQTLTQLGVGGSTAYVGIEQMALNTNLLQLIEKDAQNLQDEATSSRAREIFDLLRKGSHEADTDTALLASLDRYRAAGTLDIRFAVNESNQFIGEGLSEFERYAMSIIYRSRAINPTTNIASVQHMSDAAFRAVQTDEGLKGVRLMLGQTEELSSLASLTQTALDTEQIGQRGGILRYSSDLSGFVLSLFGSTQQNDILLQDQEAARAYIRRTLEEAKAPETESVLRFGEASVRVSRNLAAEKIVSLGINYLEQGQIERSAKIKQALDAAGYPEIPAGVNLQKFERIAGLTPEQYGGKVTPKSILQRIRSGLSGAENLRPLRNPVSMGEDIYLNYAKKLAEAGMPFASMEPRNRVMSVGLAQATSSLAEAAGMNLTSARNAKLLTEFGLSYAKLQTPSLAFGSINTEGDIALRSKPIIGFEQFFDVGQTVDEQNAITRTTLKVKAFSGMDGASEDIMSTNLNRFTLSYLDDEAPDGTPIRRLNYTWGANNTLSKDQSDAIAKYYLEDSLAFQSFLDQADTADAETAKRIAEIRHQGQSFKNLDQVNQEKVLSKVSEHVRDRGVVVMTIDDEPTIDAVIKMFKDQGVDLVDNDTRLQQVMMRIAEVNTESRVATLSAITNTNIANATGLTDEQLQKEVFYAIKAREQAAEYLEDSSVRSRVNRTVMEAQNSSTLEGMVDTTTRAVRDFVTPITDFYVKNKKPIGFAGLGLAAAGIGYYLANNYRQNKMYSEPMEQQQFELTSSRKRRSLNSPRSEQQSTRRDPLVTAGVVGNLDRSKIGHYKMGSDKYNHLYGG